MKLISLALRVASNTAQWPLTSSRPKMHFPPILTAVHENVGDGAANNARIRLPGVAATSRLPSRASRQHRAERSDPARGKIARLVHALSSLAFSFVASRSGPTYQPTTTIALSKSNSAIC